MGGIRRVIVPVELGYPVNSRGLPDWRGPQGPRPSTFAGERALDFVLSNQGLIDKTLLLDVSDCTRRAATAANMRACPIPVQP